MYVVSPHVIYIHFHFITFKLVLTPMILWTCPRQAQKFRWGTQWVYLACFFAKLFHQTSYSQNISPGCLNVAVKQAKALTTLSRWKESNEAKVLLLGIKASEVSTLTTKVGVRPRKGSNEPTV